MKISLILLASLILISGCAKTPSDRVSADVTSLTGGDVQSGVAVVAVPSLDNAPAAQSADVPALPGGAPMNDMKHYGDALASTH